MYAENLLSHNWLIKRCLNRCIAPRLDGIQGVVLDLGSGTRPFAAEILARARQYIGVDWANCLHAASPDVLADLNRPLPFADACVDSIVSFEVLEHIAEPAVMLREAHRVLKPYGTLVMSAPFQWWVHEAPWDYFRYTRHGLDHLLRKAGFSNVEITPVSGFWTTWTLKLNYQLARLTKGGRIRRLLVQSVLMPIWWVNQHLADVLDRRWNDERETAGYVLRAVK